MDAETPTIRLSAPEIRRAIIASTIGNGLEWFDFLIYGFFAAIISGVFFPAGNHAVSLMLTYATFGVGFVVRPFGGILLGLYADRAGRRAALSLLILLMAAGTVILGLTPSYASIGIAAPLIVLGARILQGLSVGGEFASSTAMLVEYAPPGKKLFYGAFQMCAQSFALTLAAGFGFVLTTSLSKESLALWGWRVPFLLGGLVGPIGFYIRRRVAESPEFTAILRAPPTRRPAVSSLAGAHLPAVVFAIGTVVAGTAGVYLWNTYLPVYVVQTLHLPLSTPLGNAAILGAINIVLNPLMGKLADRVGAYRVFVPAVAVSGLMAYPLFAFVVAHPSAGNLFAVQMVASLLGTGIAAPIPGLMAQSFPTALRSTGMAVAYNFSVAIFGGLAPLTVTALREATGSRFIPAYYLAAAAALTLALVLTFRPRVTPRR